VGRIGLWSIDTQHLGNLISIGLIERGSRAAEIHEHTSSVLPNGRFAPAKMLVMSRERAPTSRGSREASNPEAVRTNFVGVQRCAFFKRSSCAKTGRVGTPARTTPLGGNGT